VSGGHGDGLALAVPETRGVPVPLLLDQDGGDLDGRVLAHLGAHGERTSTEVANSALGGLGVRRSVVDGTLARLVASGAVLRGRGAEGRSRAAVVYRVAGDKPGQVPEPCRRPGGRMSADPEGPLGDVPPLRAAVVLEAGRQLLANPAASANAVDRALSFRREDVLAAVRQLREPDGHARVGGEVRS
jgi:hypothetical protein